MVFGFVHRYSRGRGGLHNITFCFLDCSPQVLYGSFTAELDRGVGRFRSRCFSNRVDFEVLYNS